MLSAVAAGLLGQGAYYPPVQRVVGLLVAVATVLALAASPPTRSDARPMVPALALAGWALLDTVLVGAPPGRALGLSSLLLGGVALLWVCRRLSAEDREVLLLGVGTIGLLLALAGWLGVAARVGPGRGRATASGGPPRR